MSSPSDRIVSSAWAWMETMNRCRDPSKYTLPAKKNGANPSPASNPPAALRYRPTLVLPQTIDTLNPVASESPRRPPGTRGKSGMPSPCDHQIGGGVEQIEDPCGRRRGDGADVEVEVLGGERRWVVEEAGLGRDPQLEDPLDLVLDLDADQHPLRADVDDGEQRTGGGFTCRPPLPQQVGLDEQHDARAGELDPEQALDVHDRAALDRAGDDARGRRPRIKRRSPALDPGRVALDGVHQPRRARGHVRSGLRGAVVHAEQAQQPEHGQARAAQSDPARELGGHRHQHAGRRAVAVGDGLDADTAGDAHADRRQAAGPAARRTPSPGSRGSRDR